jgi:hypothetical protein
MTESAPDRAQDAPPRAEYRPSLRFSLGMTAGYAPLLALGLLLPLLGRLSGRPNFLVNMLGYALATLVMIGASFLLALMICRVRLPYVWWMHRVLGKDVKEFQGIFFVGGSVERLSEQEHNAVFSADEGMQRWDIVFGLLTLALAVPHGIAAIVARSLLSSWYFPS